VSGHPDTGEFAVPSRALGSRTHFDCYSPRDSPANTGTSNTSCTASRRAPKQRDFPGRREIEKRFGDAVRTARGSSAPGSPSSESSVAPTGSSSSRSTRNPHSCRCALHRLARPLRASFRRVSSVPPLGPTHHPDRRNAQYTTKHSLNEAAPRRLWRAGEASSGVERYGLRCCWASRADPAWAAN
jgi:hypothetical protein